MALRSLILEIDPTTQPIRGRLSDEHGGHAFSGWLGLAAALEALISDVHPDDPPQPDHHPTTDGRAGLSAPGAATASSGGSAHHPTPKPQ